MKAIILAGGNATRFYPVTKAINKHLLPLYNKPVIYYPLSTLMLAGIKDFLIITKSKDIPNFKEILSDGSEWGISIEYAEQEEPNGLAEAFIIGKEFIGSEGVCLMLGDNILHVNDLQSILDKALNRSEGATVFSHHVSDPKRFGVVEFDKNNNVISIEEKPENPKSSFAVIGLYFYDNKVVDFASKVKPSARGELEITSINSMYLEEGKLFVQNLGRGATWFDVGKPESLLEASNFVYGLENRQGLEVANLEEIAKFKGFI